MARVATLVGEPEGPQRSLAKAPYERLPAELIADLGSDVAEGLSTSQAQELLVRHGANEIAEEPPPPAWRRFFRQFNEFVIWILIAAAVISGLLGDWPDTAAILAIVFLNAILGFVQEERAERSLCALRRLSAPFARTWRDGRLQVVPARDLVPGDVIDLEAGDYVPADCRLVESSGLKVDEASLTGESVPAEKSARVLLEAETSLGDRRNMVHLGTVAVAGKARAVCVETGMQTELGHIAGLLRRYSPETTPLQKRLKELGKVLVVVCLVAVAVLFGLQLLRGGGLLEMFLLSVSLAVAAVPEGLPAVVTITLALGLQRMAQQNALVRRLPSVETLGSVSVICSDKTGTLTRNEMTVREVVAGAAIYRVTGTGYSTRGDYNRVDDDGTETSQSAEELPADLLNVLKIAAVCNGAGVVTDGGELGFVGDPTEIALLVAAMKAGVAPGADGVPVLREIPFDSERKAMSIILDDAQEGAAVYTKGAAEVILSKCVAERLDGKVVPLSDERRQIHLCAADRMAAQALRVLGFAYGRVPSDAVEGYREGGLVFAGLVGMIDPPRDEVKEAVRTCREAGIRPVMITGDHPGTASAVARELQLLEAGDEVFSGEEIDRLADAELEALVSRVAVYARVSPEHKLRIVRAWKARGHIVAMTGDGVNDAPAVKSADIGVAMGITGTDVTKEASDMVLTDDNFATIVAAVKEGRGIFDNIQKFVQYLLSCNASEVLFMFLAVLAGWPVPLAAIQILWINLVTDGLPALALALEPPERDIMKRAPRPAEASVISRRRGMGMLAYSLLIALAAGGGFLVTLDADETRLPEARTMAFCVVAFAQLFFAVSCRSRTLTAVQLGWLRNPYLWLAIAVSGALQLTVVLLPVLRPFFKVTSLSSGQWTLVVLLSLLPVSFVEIFKWISQKTGQER